jgi:hypothetical protein
VSEPKPRRLVLKPQHDLFERAHQKQNEKEQKEHQTKMQKLKKTRTRFLVHDRLYRQKEELELKRLKSQKFWLEQEQREETFKPFLARK